MANKTRTPIDVRLYRKCKHNEVTDCWEWQGCIAQSGYGNISITLDGKKKAHLTHRVAYELGSGPIPDVAMGMNKLLASLTNEQGLLNIPGCLDGLEKLSETEINSLKN